MTSSLSSADKATLSKINGANTRTLCEMSGLSMRRVQEIRKDYMDTFMPEDLALTLFHMHMLDRVKDFRRATLRHKRINKHVTRYSKKETTCA